MPDVADLYTSRREFDSWKRRASETEAPELVAAALCYASDLATRSVLTNRQAQALVLVGSDLLLLEEAADVLDIGKSTLSEHLSTAVDKLFESRFLVRAVFDLNYPLAGLESSQSQYPGGGNDRKRILDNWQNYAFPLGTADWRVVDDGTPVWGRYSLYLEPLAGERCWLTRETYRMEPKGTTIDGEMTQFNDVQELIDTAYIDGEFETLGECVALWKTVMTSELGVFAEDASLPTPAEVWPEDITLRDVQALIQSGSITKDIAARRLTVDADASTDVMGLDEDAPLEDVPPTVVNNTE